MSEQEFEEAAGELGEFLGEPQGEQQEQAVFNAPEQAQPAPDEAQPERVRDPETGRFTTQEKLYAGKFRTPEELEQDYTQRLGSMTNEIGELRQKAAYADQLQGYLAAQQQQQQAPGAWDDEQLDRFDEYAVENPNQAADYALQSQDQILYERAMDTWYSVDPKAATRYEIGLGNQAAQQQIHQQYGSMLAPLQQNHESQQMTQAYISAAQRLPGFNQLGDQIVQAAQQYPALLQGLQAPDPQTKERAFEALYYVARGMGQAYPNGVPGAAPAAPGLPPGLAAHVASPSSLPPGAVPSAKQRVADELDALWEQGNDRG